MQLYYAYIDPSVVTLAVQAIAGAAIAVAAVVFGRAHDLTTVTASDLCCRSVL